MMINSALKHSYRYFFLVAKQTVMIGATSQKYFIAYNDLSELGSRRTVHYQLHWRKSQCSMPKNKERILFT